MAATTTVQTIFDDTKRSVIKLTGYFSASGSDETGVLKVVGQALSGALSVDANNNVLVSQGGVARTNYNYAIGHIWGQINIPANAALQLSWTGGTANTIAFFGPGTVDMVTESNMGTVWNNATGPTGNVSLTTYGTGTNSSYTLFLEIKKGPNSGNSACDYNMGQIQKPVDFNFGPGGFGITG